MPFKPVTQLPALPLLGWVLEHYNQVWVGLGLKLKTRAWLCWERVLYQCDWQSPALSHLAYELNMIFKIPFDP